MYAALKFEMFGYIAWYREPVLALHFNNASCSIRSKVKYFTHCFLCETFCLPVYYKVYRNGMTMVGGVIVL